MSDLQEKLMEKERELQEERITRQSTEQMMNANLDSMLQINTENLRLAEEINRLKNVIQEFQSSSQINIENLRRADEETQRLKNIIQDFEVACAEKDEENHRLKQELETKLSHRKYHLLQFALGIAFGALGSCLLKQKPKRRQGSVDLFPTSCSLDDFG